MLVMVNNLLHRTFDLEYIDFEEIRSKQKLQKLLQGSTILLTTS